MPLTSTCARRHPLMGAALVVPLWMAMTSVAQACNICADAATRITMPGVLNVSQVLVLFVVASAALAVFGHATRAEWRLGSRIYWLAWPAAFIGGLTAAMTGIAFLAGPILVIASLLRMYRTTKLQRPSSRERMAALLAAILVVATPTVLLVGNQRARNVDYLFDSLTSGHYITATKAFTALETTEGAAPVACERLEALKPGEEDAQKTTPMAWFGLMQLAGEVETCPELVLAVQALCAFPGDAQMSRHLACGEQPTR